MEEIEIKAMQTENESLKVQLVDATAKSGEVDSLRTQLGTRTEEVRLGALARDGLKLEIKTLKDGASIDPLLTEKDTTISTLQGDIAKMQSGLDVYVERDKEELVTLVDNLPDNLKSIVSDENASLGYRLKVARELSKKPPGPANRPPGTPEPIGDLQTQYNQAVKDGDVSLQISLQNRIYLDKEE